MVKIVMFHHCREALNLSRTGESGTLTYVQKHIEVENLTLSQSRQVRVFDSFLRLISDTGLRCSTELSSRFVDLRFDFLRGAGAVVSI